MLRHPLQAVHLHARQCCGAALLTRIQAEARFDDQSQTALQADCQGLEHACFAFSSGGQPAEAALPGWRIAESPLQTELSCNIDGGLC